jgi:HK97 family phage major capsid protein
MDKSKMKGTQFRVASFEVDALRAEDEGIPVVVSSEEPVLMPDIGVQELLVHSAEAIDLSRSPLPIIVTHEEGQLNVGLIRDLRISDGKLKGTASFGKRKEAREYESDVRSGIIRSLSVGYRRIKARVRNDGVVMTTRWMPRHAAMIAEPADPNAGFYRKAPEVDPPVEIENSVEIEAIRESGSKGKEVHQPAAKAASLEKSMASSQAAAGEIADIKVIDHTAPERLRILTLQGLARVHKIDEETRDKWITEGVGQEEAALKVLEILAERAKKSVKDSPAHLDLSSRDIQRYSITKAIRACVEKSWPKVAPYEADVSAEVARRMGKQSGEHNFFIPLDVQWRESAQRDLVVGTSSAGGYLVGTNVQSFIDILRNRSVVMRLGATTMPGLVGSVAIPKQITAATANWFASEAGTATESNITFGQLPLTPKTVGGYVEISRQLLLQSTPNAEGIVNADLAKVIGLAVDSAALTGPGTAGQPTGIASTSGVGTANPATGTNIGYADMIRFQTTVAGSNAMMPGFGYVTTPTIAGILMGKPRFTNSDTPIWGGNILDGSVVGAQALTSLQVSSATMFGGDFSQVVIGEWGVLEIEANPYAQFQSGIVGVRALYSVDVGVRYPAAFAIGVGMTA